MKRSMDAQIVIASEEEWNPWNSEKRTFNSFLIASFIQLLTPQSSQNACNGSLEFIEQPASLIGFYIVNRVTVSNVCLFFLKSQRHCLLYRTNTQVAQGLVELSPKLSLNNMRHGNLNFFFKATKQLIVSKCAQMAMTTTKNKDHSKFKVEYKNKENSKTQIQIFRLKELKVQNCFQCESTSIFPSCFIYYWKYTVFAPPFQWQ